MFGVDLLPPASVEKCPAVEDRVGALFTRILCLTMLSDDERVAVAERVLVVLDAILCPIPGIGADKDHSRQKSRKSWW